jgi:outer membrane protein TolC
MKTIFIIFSIGLGTLSLCSMVGAQGPVASSQPVLTLKDIFAEALKNSESIAVSAETVREAEALYRETLGGSFPAVSYRRTTALEDQGGSSDEGMFRVTKTDLTGYRELAALRSGRATIRQREFQLQRVEQLLLRDVALAFYSLLLAEENAASTQKLMTFARQRLEELQERIRIGRARAVDALAQEGLISSLESQLEESLRQVDSRRDLLAFLMGKTRLDREVKEAPMVTEAGALEHYLALAERRPDVQAALEHVKTSRGLREAARAEYFPSLNLAADSFTDRPKADEDTGWDVLLSVDMPLWDWGARRGKLRAAGAVVNQADKNWRFALRQAGLDIRDAYRDRASAGRQLDIQAKSVDLARRDYEMQVSDDRQGLVTNLEVLESLDRLNKAELGFNNARLQEKIAVINLETAAGAGPDEILK